MEPWPWLAEARSVNVAGEGENIIETVYFGGRAGHNEAIASEQQIPVILLSWSYRLKFALQIWLVAEHVNTQNCTWQTIKH